jgi:NDP-sugar pyrophosphorylase family protein
MVFAAGQGRRLAPLTDSIPKPLAPFLNRPMLFRTLDRLAELGVERFVVNAFHLGEQVQRALAEAGPERWGQVTLLREPVLLGTAGGLVNARSHLEGQGAFLVANGDVVWDLDLRQAWDQHLRQDNLATLVVVRRRGRPDLHKVAYRPGSGVIVSLEGVAAEGERLGIFAGLSVLSDGIFELLRVPPLTPACLVHHATGLKHQLAEHRVRACALHGRWADLGTPEELLEAHMERLAAGLAASDLPRGFRQLATGVWGPGELKLEPTLDLRPPVLLGLGVRLGTFARLGPYTVVGDRATVLSRASLRACVVLPGVSVRGAHEHEIVFASP